MNYFVTQEVVDDSNNLIGYRVEDENFKFSLVSYNDAMEMARKHLFVNIQIHRKTGELTKLDYVYPIETISYEEFNRLPEKDEEQLCNLSKMRTYLNKLKLLGLSGDIDTYYTDRIISGIVICGPWQNSIPFLIPDYVPHITLKLICDKLVVVGGAGLESLFRAFSYSRFREIDISGIRSTKVTDMRYAFAENSNLRKITIGDFYTSNIKYVDHCFFECVSLQEIDSENLKFKQIRSMDSIFGMCARLEDLDLSNIDTSNVTSMNNAFSFCGNLRSLNMSGWNTSEVLSMREMFSSMQEMKTLDLSHFDVSSVIDFNSIFSYCYSLERLNIRNWDMRSAKDLSEMFFRLRRLKHIELGEIIVDSNTKTSRIFAGVEDSLVKKIMSHIKYICTAD